MAAKKVQREKAEALKPNSCVATFLPPFHRLAAASQNHDDDDDDDYVGEGENAKNYKDNINVGQKGAG